MPESKNGFAEINGAKLYYEVAGQGPALLMLHGHLLDSGQWDEEFKYFSQNYTVVRYDGRGFGQSEGPDAPFAHHEDLRALIEFLGLGPAYLMGCSNGGATCINLAIAYPRLVKGLVLVASALHGFQFTTMPPPEVFEMLEAHEMELEKARENGETAKAVELSLQIFTDGIGRTPEQVNPTVRKRTGQMTAKLYARPDIQAHAQSLEPAAAGRLNEITVPILLIVGENDNPVLDAMAETIVREAKNAHKVVIANAGHHPNMEHPAEFAQLVSEFLAQN